MGQEYRNGNPMLICKNCGYENEAPKFPTVGTPNDPNDDNWSEPWCPMCNSLGVITKRKTSSGKCSLCGSIYRTEKPGYYTNSKELPDGRIDMGDWNPDMLVCDECGHEDYW